MFRKPMRIEKWIAFDGAALLGIIPEISDAADPSSNANSDIPEQHMEAHAEFSTAPPHTAEGDPQTDLFDFPEIVSALFQPLSEQTTNILDIAIPGYPEFAGDIQLTMPIAPVLTTGLPFIHDDIFFSIGGSANGVIRVQDLYLSISFPENGGFALPVFAASDDPHDYITLHGIPEGTLLAYSVGGEIPTSDIYTGTVNVAVVAKDGSGHYYLTDKVHAVRSYIIDNSVRFGFTDDATTQHVAALLRSLVFTEDSDPATSDNSFSIGLYHDTRGNAYSPYKLIGGEDCAIQPGYSAGTIEDATKPCNSEGNIIDSGGPTDPTPLPPDPDPDPEPEPDPDPDPDPPPPDPIPPVDDPQVPIIPGGNDASDDSGSDAGDPDSGNDAEAEDGGPGADAGDIGLLAWAVNHLEEEEEETASEATPAKMGIDSPNIGATESGRDGDLETAADAAAAELLRDVGLILAGARENDLSLAKAMARLHREYAAYPPDSWEAAARGHLKDIFHAGNQARRNFSQFETQLTQQTALLLDTPREHREGMQHAVVRDLADSTARLSGTTDAMAKAMDTLAAHLQTTRENVGQPPGGRELAGVYDASFSQALLEREAQLAHRDPMAKELEHFERLREREGESESERAR